jgi:hypothetical protein
VSVDDVTAYADLSAGTYRVRTTRDVLPGGLSMAMVPAFVDWDRSNLAEGGDVVLRNVNHGGNPLSGITELRTARVRTDQVARVEWVEVPLGGPRAVSHGQLRFVFEPGGAELFGGEVGAVGEADSLTDLVLSWEAWRPPGVDYDVLRGMEPGNYQLSMRAYSGPQRFLEDTLIRRDWHVYTLDLPGGRRGASELLRVALALGDGAARAVIAGIRGDQEDEWVVSGPDSESEGGDAAAQWRTLREQVVAAGIQPADARLDLSEHSSYQSLLRSCATMALYSIRVTVERLEEAGLVGEGTRAPRIPEIREVPDWMTDVASADLAKIFVHAPIAIRYVVEHPTTIPGNIPKELADSGLLVMRGDRSLVHHYSLETGTPWGSKDHLLIR